MQSTMSMPCLEIWRVVRPSCGRVSARARRTIAPFQPLSSLSIAQPFFFSTGGGPSFGASPLPAEPPQGAVTAPPSYAPAYPPAYPPPAYAAGPYAPYTQPVGTPVVVRPAVPVFVAPVGVSLSVGGGWGHHRHGGGWGISVGNAW